MLAQPRGQLAVAPLSDVASHSLGEMLEAVTGPRTVVLLGNVGVDLAVSAALPCVSSQTLPAGCAGQLVHAIERGCQLSACWGLPRRCKAGDGCVVSLVGETRPVSEGLCV